MVPREYSNECIVARVTPYQVIDELSKGTQTRTGVLDIGRVVWTSKPLSETGPTDKIDTYVDGVGPVQLDAQNLKPY